MRPPVVKPGQQRHLHQQRRAARRARHRAGLAQRHLLPAPCNRGSGIGYPLAAGPIEFDSGQLGYGTGLSTEVTTGSQPVYTTPPLTKPGKTYTYFCRIHPFMRGSIRVAGGKPKHR